MYQDLVYFLQRHEQSHLSSRRSEGHKREMCLVFLVGSSPSGMCRTFVEAGGNGQNMHLAIAGDRKGADCYRSAMDRSAKGCDQIVR